MTVISNVSRMTEDQQARAVFEILSDAYGQSPWSMKQVLADLKQETTDYVYVYDQEQVVGFLALQHLVGELEVTNIAVRKAYQGRGYASQLLQQLVGLAEPVFLEVRASNTVAQSLYQKFGFASLGIRKEYYHEPLEDAIIMRREGD